MAPCRSLLRPSDAEQCFSCLLVRVARAASALLGRGGPSALGSLHLQEPGGPSRGVRFSHRRCGRVSCSGPRAGVVRTRSRRRVHISHDGFLHAIYRSQRQQQGRGWQGESSRVEGRGLLTTAHRAPRRDQDGGGAKGGRDAVEVKCVSVGSGRRAILLLSRVTVGYSALSNALTAVATPVRAASPLFGERGATAEIVGMRGLPVVPVCGFI